MNDIICIGNCVLYTHTFPSPPSLSPPSLPPSSLSHACSSSSSELRRRQQREERKDRLASQVNSMKGRLREQEDEQEVSGDVAVTSELSVPWLVLGFAVMVGYCFYYLFS